MENTCLQPSSLTSESNLGLRGVLGLKGYRSIAPSPRPFRQRRELGNLTNSAFRQPNLLEALRNNVVSVAGTRKRRTTVSFSRNGFGDDEKRNMPREKNRGSPHLVGPDWVCEPVALLALLLEALCKSSSAPGAVWRRMEKEREQK